MVDICEQLGVHQCEEWPTENHYIHPSPSIMMVLAEAVFDGQIRQFPDGLPSYEMTYDDQITDVASSNGAMIDH
jgi:hypothetical protein